MDRQRYFDLLKRAAALREEADALTEEAAAMIEFKRFKGCGPEKVITDIGVALRWHGEELSPCEVDELVRDQGFITPYDF